jgi:hypothetical protein
MFETIEQYIAALFKLPKNPLVDKWIAVFNEMAVHTRKRKPEELLLKARPNEEPNIIQYRLDNFEPITYGSMNRAFDNLYRLMNAINFNIVAPDNVLEYIKQNIFESFSLIMYAQKIVLKRNIEDPNGFLLWIPAGKGTKDSSVKVEPRPYLFYSSQFIYKDENVWIFLSNETSLYFYEGAYHEGKVYYAIDKNEVWKVKQNGPDEKADFIGEIFYAHKLGDFPVIVLGGDLNAENFNESYFAAYVAFGNQAIRQFSDWQAIMVTSGFPIIEEFATECEVKTSVKRNSESKDATEEKYEQKVQLKPFHKSPMGIVLRPVASDNEANLDFEGKLPVDVPFRRYITPDVEITKYSGESWQLLLEKAEEALNLNLTQPNQSGVAKEYDNETKYSMINKIGNNLFDNILLKSIKIIDGYLNKKTISSSSVFINKPTTFNIKTEGDLVSQISTLKEKKAPAMFLSEATVELSRKMFSGSPVAQKIFKVISTFDPLFIYSVEEKNEMILNNTASKEDVIKSTHLYAKLLQISQRIGSENFLKTDDETLYKIFVAEMGSLLPQQTPLTNPDGSPATNSETEKAQANLRGSVGGVQGILSVQTSVAQGTTTFDSGLAILKYVYGFAEAEATELLGEPEPIDSGTPPA